MSFVRRTNGYLMAGERLKDNKTRILDIGGTHFRVKNNGDNITIDNINLHFDSKGNLTVFRDATNSITLHSLDELKKDLFYYIEVFYNRKRLHTSLGYMSSVP